MSNGSPTYLPSRSKCITVSTYEHRSVEAVLYRVNALSPIVDPEIVNVVDLANLRRLCSYGKCQA